MNTNYPNKNSARGFTLIEVGVVLAIIGVLAAISIPSVSYFLRQGRVKSVAGSIGSIKNWIGNLQSSTSAGGMIPITEGGRPPTTGNALGAQDAELISRAARLDLVLVSTGIADKLVTFAMGNQVATPEGTGTDLQWNPRRRAFYVNDGSGGVSATATADRDWDACSRIESRLADPTLSPSVSSGANFRLDGVNNMAANTVVAYAILKDVPFKDAVELGKAMNGEDLMTATEDNLSAQESGAVVFARPLTGTATTDVYIYVASM